MQTFLVVIDGTNLVNDVGRYLGGVRPQPDLLSPYLRRWFDIDRLVLASLVVPNRQPPIIPTQDLGIVIFRSRKKLGESGWGIEGHADLDQFWARQGSNPASSVMLVDVPGAPPGKEAALDMSMAVHLFETADHWDAAVLFTNDADFVPAVWALRRKGKRVYCSSHVADDVSRPLVQACQHFFPWDVEFLETDWAMFNFLQPGGLFDQVVTRDDVKVLQPRLKLDGGRMCLWARTGGFRDDHSNIINEVFRDTPFFATRSSSDAMEITMRSSANAAGFRPVIEDSQHVTDGLRRHGAWFSGATWSQLPMVAAW